MIYIFDVDGNRLVFAANFRAETPPPLRSKKWTPSSGPSSLSTP